MALTIEAEPVSHHQWPASSTEEPQGELDLVGGGGQGRLLLRSTMRPEWGRWPGQEAWETVQLQVEAALGEPQTGAMEGTLLLGLLLGCEVTLALTLDRPPHFKSCHVTHVFCHSLRHSYVKFVDSLTVGACYTQTLLQNCAREQGRKQANKEPWSKNTVF